MKLRIPNCQKAFERVSVAQNSSCRDTVAEKGCVLCNHIKMRFELFSNDNIASNAINSSDIGMRLFL